ncbi:hypothetical protein IV203_026071 [Nitzschia inconspicua]|uniref:Uncharacterized protein n=1 Tax=Nitzschia inconspicua TaxID=303405 RepID=A0A9K3PX81_9STRA|nr:hypothetical protein IV203_026071 [Nitzschia inconspicua]
MSLASFPSKHRSPADRTENGVKFPPSSALERPFFILMNPALIHPRVRKCESFIGTGRLSLNQSIHSSCKELFRQDQNRQDTVLTSQYPCDSESPKQREKEAAWLPSVRSTNVSHEVERILNDLATLDNQNEIGHKQVNKRLSFEGVETSNELDLVLDESHKKKESFHSLKDEVSIEWADTPVLTDPRIESSNDQHSSASARKEIEENTVSSSTLRSVDVLPCDSGYEITLGESGQEVTFLQYLTSTMLEKRFFATEHRPRSIQSNKVKNAFLRKGEPSADKWLTDML